MNEAMAYVLGVLKGDGCIWWGLNHGKRTPIVSLEVTDSEFANSFLGAIKTVAPWVKTKVYQRKAYSEYGEIKAKHIVRVSAVKLHPLIRKAERENLLAQPPSVIAHFLRGYFDSEGHVTNISIGATLSNYKRLKYVQRLLNKLEIRSRIYTAKNVGILPSKKYRREPKTIFQLRISDYNSRLRYAQKISFSIPRKRQALERAFSKRTRVSHSKTNYFQVLALRKEGLSLSQIAEKTNVPQGTLQHWIYSNVQPWEVKP